MDTQSDNSPAIVIFGITGDLSRKKLLPALYDLFKEDILDSETRILGTSRRSLDKQDLLSSVELDVLSDDQASDPAVVEKMNQALNLIQVDPENDDDYEKLKQALDKLDDHHRRLRLFYMSIPSSAYEPIVERLASHGLNDERSRLMLEKPFGHDLNSAEASIKFAHNAFNEEQIYRIDHYLAKEMSQNIIQFRMFNPSFNTLWNANFIKSVHIKQFETIGIEGRADFYEQTGALKDVVQNHLMQLLAITLMNVPTEYSSDAIHKSKQDFFSSLNPANPSEAKRAQYDTYKSEVNNPDSSTETYARIKLTSNLDAWQGTEFILEHGKAMSESIASVTVEFKSSEANEPNNLVFQIQPNDGIILDLRVKRPGLDNQVGSTSLDFRYRDAFKNFKSYDAYEKVIVDAINGNQSLFAADKEVLTSWEVLQPILETWAGNSDGLTSYTVNSKESGLT
jgi:glucose-6-phosphate 1-dehydrogenase